MAEQTRSATSSALVKERRCSAKSYAACSDCCANVSNSEIAEADRLEHAVRVDLHSVELVEEKQQAERDEDHSGNEREQAVVIAHPAEKRHPAHEEHRNEQKGQTEPGRICG